MSLLEESYEPPLSKGPTGPHSPIPSYQLKRDVGGVATDIIIQTFDDRILVLVTQSGKIGCLVNWIFSAHPSLSYLKRSTQRIGRKSNR
jgi:hypothetical protein